MRIVREHAPGLAVSGYGPVNAPLSTCERGRRAAAGVIRLSRVSSATPAVPRLSTTRRFTDRIGDRVLLGLTVGASIVAIAVIVVIIYKLVDGASGVDLEVRSRLPVALDLEPVGLGGRAQRERVRRRHAALRHGGDLWAGAAVRGAARHRASASTSACSRRVASGAVIGPLVELLAAVPERDHRPLGDHRPRALHALDDRAGPPRCARLHSDLRSAVDDRTRHLHREHRPRR